MSVFDPIVDDRRLGTGFRRIASERHFAPARAVIDAVYERMGDPDGNFVEQFQTTGTDARLWELYLFAAFEEQGWSIDRSQPAPDFLLSDGRLEWGVEATTASGHRAGAGGDDRGRTSRVSLSRAADPPGEPSLLQ